MMRALNTAATGMTVQQMKVDLIANNLANVNTVGFKRSRGEFEELLYQTMRGPGLSTGAGTKLPTGVQVGLGARTVGTQKIFTDGSLQPSENPLDLAIGGKGFFQVRRPDGSLAYTRAGGFHQDENGTLVTPDGYPVEPQISLPPDAGSIEVAEDGRVTVRRQGQTESVEVGQLQLAMFANPAGLLAEGQSLFTPTSASGEALAGTPGQEGLGRIMAGNLESSNVQVVEEMIEMITGQRAYEMNSKVIQTADQMLRAASSIR